MNKVLLIFFYILLFSCGENTPNTSPIMEFTSDLDSLNTLLEKEPKNLDALSKRAKTLYKNGEFDLAINDLNQKMAISATDEDYYLKGNIFFSNLQIKNNAENANKAYRLCINENPENANCYVKLAQIQQLLDNYDECIQLVDSALIIDKQLPDAYFMKGLTFELRRAKGDSALAISSYQTSIELDPNFYDSYMRLGNLHAAKNDSLAIQYYKSAIYLQPERIEAHYNLAIYLQNSGKFDNAMKRYDRILEIDPFSFLAQFNQGYLLLVFADQYEQATTKFSQSILNNPEYTEAYHNRGLCHKNLGRYADARSDFKKALQLNPDFDLSAIQLNEIEGF